MADLGELKRRHKEARNHLQAIENLDKCLKSSNLMRALKIVNELDWSVVENNFPLKQFVTCLLQRHVCALIKLQRDDTVSEIWLRKILDLEIRCLHSLDLKQCSLVGLINLFVRSKQWAQAESEAAKLAQINSQLSRKYSLRIALESGRLTRGQFREFLNQSDNMANDIRFGIQIISIIKPEERKEEFLIEATDAVSTLDKDLGEKVQLFVMIMMMSLDGSLYNSLVKCFAAYVAWHRSLSSAQKSSILSGHEKILDYSEHQIRHIISRASSCSPADFEIATQLTAALVLLDGQSDHLGQIFSYQAFCIRASHGLEQAQKRLQSIMKRSSLPSLKKLLVDIELEDFNPLQSNEKVWQTLQSLRKLCKDEPQELVQLVRAVSADHLQEEVKDLVEEAKVRLLAGLWARLDEDHSARGQLELAISEQSSNFKKTKWISRLLWNVALKSRDNSFALFGQAGRILPHGDSRTTCRIAQLGSPMPPDDALNAQAIVAELSQAEIRDQESRTLIRLFRGRACLLFNLDHSELVLEVIKDGDIDSMEMLVSLLASKEDDAEVYAKDKEKLLQMCIVLTCKNAQVPRRKTRGLAAGLALLQSYLDVVDEAKLSNLMPQLITLAQVPSSEGDQQEDDLAQSLVFLIVSHLWNGARKLSVSEAFERFGRPLRAMASSLVDYAPKFSLELHH